MEEFNVALLLAAVLHLTNTRRLLPPVLSEAFTLAMRSIITRLALHGQRILVIWCTFKFGQWTVPLDCVMVAMSLRLVGLDSFPRLTMGI